MSQGRFLTIVIVCLVLGACGSGSSSGSSSGGEPANPPSTQTQAPELASLAPTTIVATADMAASTDQTISFRNAGSADLTYSAATSAAWITFLSGSAGRVIPNGSAQLDLRIDCSQGSQTGEIRIATNDEDEPSAAVGVAVTCNDAAHAITRLTLNQASRAYDSDEGSGMAIASLAARDMLVRAFVTGEGAVPEGDVVLMRSGEEFRFQLHSPLAISPALPDESLLSASHYVIVPGSAIQPDSELYVEIGGVRYPADGAVDLSVADPGTLGITFVPVTADGRTPALVADTYLAQTIQQLPVGDYRARVRTPYVFTGSFDLDRLLDEITDLRTLDGSTDLYHAVVIPPSGGGAQTAGLGYVGFPVSVSVDLNGSQNIISHEIGHNLNLRHAPACDAPNTDPDFPNPDGTILNWGFDVLNQRLVDPDTGKADLMSYCSDVWISRYSFDKALQYRAASAPAGTGNAGELEKVLTVRGRLTDSGVRDVTFLPGNRDIARRDIEHHSFAYRFQAWDRNGSPVIDEKFAPFAIEHGRADELGFAFPTSPDVSAQAIHHYTVSKAGQVLSSVLVSPPSTEAELEMRTAGRTLQWQGSEGHRLIMRNIGGEVISMTGQSEVVLPGGVHSIEIAGPALSTAPTSLDSSFRRIDLLR